MKEGVEVLGTQYWEGHGATMGIRKEKTSKTSRSANGDEEFCFLKPVQKFIF